MAEFTLYIETDIANKAKEVAKSIKPVFQN